MEAKEISSQSFLRLVDLPREYNPGKDVTRENFVSMLVMSFYVSKADFFRHEMFFRWVQAKTSFNYESTLDNFFEVGGWNCLSENEKRLFTGYLESVQSHFDHDIVTEFRDNPNLILKRNLPQYFYRDEEVQWNEDKEDIRKFIAKNGQLVRLNFQEFVSRLNNFERYVK